MKLNSIFILFFLVFIVSSISAQTSKGPILWLQADSGVVLSGEKISSWVDQSGMNNSVSQDDASFRPTLISNIINGHSAVKFHGWSEFLKGPSIFPYKRDYTITVVVRVDDSNSVQNLVSGTEHALFFDHNLYPRVVHEDFSLLAISSLELKPEFGIVTVRYSEYNEQLKFYVNGQSGDSLYIRTNHSDSTLLIGAFRGTYGLNGSISEILLYDRQISEVERISLESSLRSKYNIPLGTPIPKPDSTFTYLPANFQLYPREKNDSGIVKIEGKIYKPNFDSIYVQQFKNDTLILRESKQLEYKSGEAAFSFLSNIHSELSEFRFEVHLKNTTLDTTIATRDSIVCGDVYFIGGESNATLGYWDSTYQNEYCRTFGINFLHNPRDTIWSRSQAQKWGDGPSVSGWGLMLQKLLVENQNIPTCIINGGLSGTIINYHMRDSANPTSQQTIYGRMLYRAQSAGVANAAKAIIWFHGEIDCCDYYPIFFNNLYKQWHGDYLNLKKIYMIQMRPGYCVSLGNPPLRNWQRMVQDSLPDIESVSSSMFPNQDGCHYFEAGFPGIASQLYPMLARDFYGSTDTIGITSPNITKAFYTTPQNTEIGLVFSPHNCGISATNDTTVGGIFATIKDYFYPNDEVGKIESIRFSGDTVYLKLYSASNAKFISHIPDRYYNGSDSVYYQGPWLKSSRGVGALIFWHFPINDWKSGVNIDGNSSEISLEAIPNPTKSTTLVRFNTSMNGPVSLYVYDVLGRKIRTLTESRLTQGIHEISFDASELPAGEYFCRLQVGEKTITKKIILTK